MTEQDILELQPGDLIECDDNYDSCRHIEYAVVTDVEDDLVRFVWLPSSQYPEYEFSYETKRVLLKSYEKLS